MIQNIDHKPELNWWVKHVLQKQDQIVAKFPQHGAQKYMKTKMKFVIECLNTVDQDLALDKKN